ncbi:MarR family winged helix-turn-helix transcriptional regulator [Streptomyces kanamyceticus]|uniref:MarR family transcriptional regulator n=1 Tax=Streptomyces kanamyceticus TaxID=1967 RepID=A0A5J6G5K9_STRKN|nr:MarR family transcriptional regulator [Streptomyces kanamyceticus]QEU90950.1 MarR family transcriptional regulator [Streptomyces kanamyceticus]
MTVDQPTDPRSATAPESPIREQLRNLIRCQQRFERYQGRQMHVDPAGLAVMDHLVSAGPVTPSELARELSTSTAAMTLVIDRLVDGGHVSRRPHPSDRRKVLVTPTEHWEESAFEHVEPLVAGIGEITESMTAQEQATVATFLERAVAAYDRATKV